MMVITPEHGPELPNVSGEYTFEPLPESTKEEYVYVWPCCRGVSSTLTRS